MKLLRLFSLFLASSILSACTLWEQSEDHIYNRNDGNVGVGTSTPDSKLTVIDESTTPIGNFSGMSATISSPSEARAIYGAAINPNSVFNYGGYFTSAGNSYGVFGEASDEERGRAGGLFHSYGKEGRGVAGFAFNNGEDVENYGGYFDARGKRGVGVFAKGGEDGYAGMFNGNVKIREDRVTQALVVDGKGGIGGTLATELKGGLGVNGGAYITSQQGYAIWAQAQGIAAAALFDGEVTVTGPLIKSGGGFMIDHPLDPANKYLYHSFVESPDMMNVYNGNATLDSKGEATVKLPLYFEALNKNFRYQLTAIGAGAPNLHVAKKISGNSFTIAGGKPGMEVSWQVTGTRDDAYAKAHRISPEISKELTNRGKFLHPKEFGKSESLKIGWRRNRIDGDNRSQPLINSAVGLAGR
ncbi:MAG: hypothetical protein OET44_11235 [Gammaproteobacteria bacterium]|nr:hypothetical protein [Gammaproteobacteria bacterium]